MTPDEKIEPLGSYRSTRPLQEGSVFAKYRVKKKILKKEQEKSEEERKFPEEESKGHRVDIEA